MYEKYAAEQVPGELATPEVAKLIGIARDELPFQAKELDRQVASAHRRQKKLGADHAAGSGMSLAAFKAAGKELTALIRDESTRARFVEHVKHAPVGAVPGGEEGAVRPPLAADRGVPGRVRDAHRGRGPGCLHLAAGCPRAGDALRLASRGVSEDCTLGGISTKISRSTRPLRSSPHRITVSMRCERYPFGWSMRRWMPSTSVRVCESDQSAILSARCSARAS